MDLFVFSPNLARTSMFAYWRRGYDFLGQVQINASFLPIFTKGENEKKTWKGLGSNPAPQASKCDNH